MQEGIINLIILLGFSAFFSGVETALVSVSQVTVNSLLEKKRRGAHYLNLLKSDPHKMLTTILIGNNLVNIGAAALTTKLMIERFGDGVVGIATGVLTAFILIFGEITPKSLATRYSEKISLFTASLIYGLSKLFIPIIWVLDLFTLKVINAVAGPPPKEKVTEDELKNFIKLSEQSGSINKEETKMLQNIIEFEDLTVKEIMTPRPDVKTVDSGTKIKKVVKQITKTGHSRFPVLDNSGNVIGLVLAKDLLSKFSSGKIDILVDNVIRDALFVPETKKLDELLSLFRRGKSHMAIVVDEYGGVSGIVTLEDLLEEIVGDLFDESDKLITEIKPLKNGEYAVIGTTYLSDLNAELNIHLESESDVESIGGYIVEKLGKIPEAGETYEERGIVFTVKKMDENRISKLQIRFKRRKKK